MAMHLEAKDEMPDPQDTEITLGTGKMLVLFFGLVVLCSVFFALGFKLGRSSSLGPELTSTPSSASTGNAAAKPATKPADSTPPKTVSQDTPPAQAPAENTAKPADSSNNPASAATPADTTATPASSNYFVQVAAVSKQEDADALVDALKKKQYAAFSTALSDKLIRIQVGPFNDIKEAEATRAKLVGDGYNPILKK
jgi:DedD protein